MDKSLLQESIITFIFGYLGASIPNSKSNIHPLLLAALFGSLATKVIFGDWDVGYQYSFSDILFWSYHISIAIFAGLLAIAINN